MSTQQLAVAMKTDVTKIEHIESYPGNLKFSDIKLFSDALKISINELEYLLK
jgi:ribosome-binding protein aMBF1 (putative translation factor)